MERKASHDSDLCGFNHSTSFEDLFEPVLPASKPPETTQTRCTSQQRPRRIPSQPRGFSRTQQHFSSKQQDQILSTYRSVLRQERIPLLDDPQDSSGDEKEAKMVLETLHLRFSRNTEKQVTMQSKPTERYTRERQCTQPPRLRRYRPVQMQAFSTILNSWKAIFAKRNQPHRAKTALRMNKRFVCSPMKRTVDGSAFMVVSAAQPLSPRDLFQSHTRPTSAGTWSKRKFLRATSHYRPGV